MSCLLLQGCWHNQDETKGRVEWGFSHMWWNTGDLEKWVWYFGVMATLHAKEKNLLFKSKNR